MDHPLIDLINARIKTAEQEGAFDNLEGAGRPLKATGDPQDAMLSRLMKENGAVPEAVQLTREVADLRAKLRETSDRNTRTALIRDIALKETRLEVLLRRG